MSEEILKGEIEDFRAILSISQDSVRSLTQENISLKKQVEMLRLERDVLRDIKWVGITDLENQVTALTLELKEMREALEWLAENRCWLTIEKHVDNYTLRNLIQPERSKIVSHGSSPLEAIKAAKNAVTKG